MREAEFARLLREYWPELEGHSQERVLRFYQLLLAENEVQNLTRLVSPEEFLYGHVVDVRELLRSGLLEFPAMDLGSGCGVPGLLSSLVAEGSWILAESEGHKADFLRRAVQECGVSDRVAVYSGRAENFLKEKSVRTVVARAVGPVDRIFAWIRDCSTWNKMVLLKGPGWKEEWDRFLSGRDRKKLVWKGSHEYSVGPEAKQRIIVEIERVPRGTFQS